MSILQQVIDEYGISEKSKPLTDKTDKRVVSTKALPDKTAKRASVSSVSDRSEGFEYLDNDEIDAQEVAVVDELEEIVRMREAGVTPHHYTSQTTCKHCGPVPIWNGCPPEVQGCPWCFNRHKGLPIPKGETSID